MCTCTFRQLVPTNNFKAYKAFPGYVPLNDVLDLSANDDNV